MSSWTGSAGGEDIGIQEEGRVQVAWRVVREGGVLALVQGDGHDLFG
jgi:ribonuclease P/MRP protein subunit POP8